MNNYPMSAVPNTLGHGFTDDLNGRIAVDTGSTFSRRRDIISH
jgi:hypothetical protein